MHELIAALRLTYAVPELSSVRLEHSDRPDLRLHLHGDIYGLEVTRIVRGRDDAIKRVRWIRAVERIARLLRQEKNYPPAWVSLRWNGEPPPAGTEETARLLIDVVEEHLPMTVGAMAYLDPGDLSDEVMRFVHGLDIRRTRTDDLWVSGFSNNPDVQPHELQAVIDEKAGLIAGYSRENKGLWLLIYGEATNAAQALDINDDAKSAWYSGPFDRVFFVDCMNKAAELRLVRQAEFLLR
jgi:hypothetical protein